MNKLSIKQKILLEAIEYFIKQNGYPPTYNELSILLKCKKETVFERVMVLDNKGYIKTTNGKARSIVVLRSADSEFR